MVGQPNNVLDNVQLQRFSWPLKEPPVPVASTTSFLCVIVIFFQNCAVTKAFWNGDIRPLFGFHLGRCFLQPLGAVLQAPAIMKPKREAVVDTIQDPSEKQLRA